LNYFAKNGFICPEHFNPGDFLIDLISLDSRTVDLEMESRSRIQFFVNIWKEKENSSVILIKENNVAKMNFVNVKNSKKYKLNNIFNNKNNINNNIELLENVENKEDFESIKNIEKNKINNLHNNNNNNNNNDNNNEIFISMEDKFLIWYTDFKVYSI
jgi:hypothetical protein